MKRLASKMTVLLSIVGILSLLGGQMPASAAAAGVVVGGGIIVPGVPGPTGGTVANSVHFNGTATGVFVGGSADAGSCNIDFSGSGTDSTAVGQGTGTATCNGTGVLGGSISLSCPLAYTRVAVIVVVIGACAGGGPLVGAFVFVPTNVNPTTAYQLVGVTATAP
jgi:hypothetical protein